MIINRVLNNKNGNPGSTPYEVLSFDSQADYDATETEADFKRKIIAKFNTCGDATLYAHNLNNAPNAPKIILIRA